jgi:hypothetical protein
MEEEEEEEEASLCHDHGANKKSTCTTHMWFQLHVQLIEFDCLNT